MTRKDPLQTITLQLRDRGIQGASAPADEAAKAAKAKAERARYARASDQINERRRAAYAAGAGPDDDRRRQVREAQRRRRERLAAARAQRWAVLERVMRNGAWHVVWIGPSEAEAEAEAAHRPEGCATAAVTDEVAVGDIFDA